MVLCDSTQLSRLFYLSVLTLFLSGGCCSNSKPSPLPSAGKYTEQSALGMVKASRGTLSPVYAPLAEQIVADFDLDKKTGIGIDLGSGPGTLIIELCKRTQLTVLLRFYLRHFFHA